MRIFLPVLFIAWFATVGHAQTTFLDQSFSGPSFPPAGWSEDNNGISDGWSLYIDSAWHDDFAGANDNRLITPAMDFSGVSAVYLHGYHGSNWSGFRDLNQVQASLDGGLSWQTLYTETSTTEGRGQSLEIDLSSLAGQASVEIGFRYRGGVGNEWILERLWIDDQPPSTPLLWPNLPSSVTSVSEYLVDFEVVAFPPVRSLNQLDELTRRLDNRGWCNIGQRAPAIYARGTGALEMGLKPGDPGAHPVANALILGLTGDGETDLWIEFEVRNLGEELDPDDGVWISQDGVSWTAMLTDWQQATGGQANENTWQVVRLPLDGHGVDVSVPFYVAIAQADNRPFNEGDGLVVDNIRTWVRPELTVIESGIGNVGIVLVEKCLPGRPVRALYSLTGVGPTLTQYGVLDLSLPIRDLGAQQADAAGWALWASTVPTSLAGKTLYLQASQDWNGFPLVSQMVSVQF